MPLHNYPILLILARKYFCAGIVVKLGKCRSLGRRDRESLECLDDSNPTSFLVSFFRQTDQSSNPSAKTSWPDFKTKTDCAVSPTKRRASLNLKIVDFDL